MELGPLTYAIRIRSAYREMISSVTWGRRARRLHLWSPTGGASLPISEASLLLSPHWNRHVDCILEGYIAQSCTHPGLVITPSSTVSTAQHQARVGQHGFVASFGCILNLLTSPNLVQTLSQYVDATSNVSLFVPDQACRAQRCSKRQCSYPLGYLSSSHSLVCQLVHAQRPREEVGIRSL
jgi:hypothetical protein